MRDTVFIEIETGKTSTNSILLTSWHVEYRTRNIREYRTRNIEFRMMNVCSHFDVHIIPCSLLVISNIPNIPRISNKEHRIWNDECVSSLDVHHSLFIIGYF